MTGFLLAVGALGGGALVWFAKDALIKLVIGSENFIRALEAKTAALKAAVRP